MPAAAGDRERLLSDLGAYRRVAELSPSPFYATLLERIAADVRDGGPSWEILAPFADQPREEYYAFRVLAGVHHEVLAGLRPQLARHYPSAGGDGDAEAAWPGVREAIADRDPALLAELPHPLQTNETSRCGALIGGFCEVARADGLPIRALELGASAGLNLHLDSYRYEQGALALGPESSPIRFRDYWTHGVPALDTPLRIESRAGCDVEPIDPRYPPGEVSLEAYLFPDQPARLEELRAAIAISREHPIRVERASADEWIERELAEPADDKRSTVVFHSVFWTYLPDAVQERIREALIRAGEAASERAPVHWLSYEVGAEPTEVELRLRSWPGGEERLLGVGRHHAHPVRWLA